MATVRKLLAGICFGGLLFCTRPRAPKNPSKRQVAAAAKAKQSAVDGQIQARSALASSSGKMTMRWRAWTRPVSPLREKEFAFLRPPMPAIAPPAHAHRQDCDGNGVQPEANNEKENEALGDDGDEVKDEGEDAVKEEVEELDDGDQVSAGMEHLGPECIAQLFPVATRADRSRRATFARPLWSHCLVGALRW